MKLFKCNENVMSYVFPSLKIVFACILIVFFCSRNYFIHINNTLVDVVFRIIGCIVVVASAFCIYMAIAEMILLHERRSESGIDIELAISNSKNYATDYIISLMQKNDIIEFLIVSNNKIIKLGASSNSHNGSSQFFDKRYYISDQENITIEVLSEVINKYSIDGKICVIKIDGMSPNDFEGS